MRLSLGIVSALAAFSVVTEAQQTSTLDLTVKSSIGQILGYSAVEISSDLSRFTDETGRLVIAIPGAAYRLRIKHLGYKAVDTAVVIPPGGSRYSLSVTLEPIVVQVATTEVRARTSCRILSETESDLGRVVGELRKNAEREKTLRNSYPFLYTLAREIELAGPFGTTKHRDTVQFRSITNDPYIPGKLVRDATKPVGTATRELRVPTLIDLADEPFLKSHCFYYRGLVKLNGVRAHRIDFKPLPGVKEPDVRGSAWLDANSFIIRRAFFSLENGDLLDPPVIGLDVTTTYKEIFPGLAINDLIRGVQQVARGMGSRGDRVEEQRLIAVHFLNRMPGDKSN